MDCSPKVCRVCLIETPDYVEFSDQLERTSHEISILDAFNVCTNLEASINDGLSQIFCHPCMDKLRMSYQFILTAEKSDRLLKERNCALNKDISIENYTIMIEEIPLSAANDPKESGENCNIFGVEEVSDETDEMVSNQQTRHQAHPYVCDKNFSISQILTRDSKTVKNYLCDKCPKSFRTLYCLRHHSRIHTGEKPFACDECDLRFCYSNTLTCHKRTHSGERPYECSFCHKKFTQSAILKTHMTTHTGKTIECTMCDKKFSRQSELTSHKRKHTGEKPYNCTICGNDFTQKCHLNRHLAAHAGVKHKCKFCHKQYTSSSSLKIHMFEHTGQKPFKCSLCTEQFARKDKFRIHLKKHNKVIKADNSIADISDH